jgi:hypothetical protein
MPIMSCSLYEPQSRLKAEGALVAQELNHLINAVMEGSPSAILRISPTAPDTWPPSPPRLPSKKSVKDAAERLLSGSGS